MNRLSLVLGLATLLFIGSAYSKYNDGEDEVETDGENGRNEGEFMDGHRHGGRGGMGGTRMHGGRHRHRGVRHEGNMGVDMETGAGDAEIMGGSDGHVKGIGSRRHGGRGGIGSRSGGGRRGGMGGGRGGKESGRGGRGGGRGGRRGAKGDRKQRRQELIKQKEEQRKIVNLVKGMTNFTSGNYQRDSTMMTLYVHASDKVGSLLAKRQEILLNKLRIANVNGKIRLQVTNGANERPKKLTERLNSKCQHKFAALVKKFGENPTGQDLKTATKSIEKIAAHYLEAVKQLFDHLSGLLDKSDKGYYLDEVKQENGNPKKFRALMRDVKKIAANLGCAIQEKKADMEPHHDKNHMPSAAETHLIKRLGSARVHALDAFAEYQKKILAENKPKDRTLPIDIRILRKSLKLLEAKKDELLEKAVNEMKEIIEKEKVTPELVDLKEKLSELGQDIFNKEKRLRKPQMKAMMKGMLGRVEGKPGAKLLVRMLREQSKREMANMQDAIGDAVLDLVQSLGSSGGSLDEQVKEGSSSLKFKITDVMDKAKENLQQFVESKIKDMETGKGIFGHMNQMDHRQRN